MPLAPIVGALLPTLIEAVPKLGKLFGSGSAVAERNVKAAELAMGIVQQATGAVNAQAAVEAVKADPAKAQAATRAIESRWLELTETGGGGVSGARQVLTSAGADSPIWRIVAVVTYAALVFLGLANLIASAAWSVAMWRAAGIESATQFLSQVLTADIGAAMVAFGFWLGSSWGSKQKTAEH